ncbi:MAG: ABC transporter ATP-binding protein [Gemmatimonas sp.]|nr:ABC transporter ATP-binding protein [Gemmatimonas sp.]
MLQVYFVLTGIVQVAGVGSIAPFVALVADPTLVQRNRLMGFVYHAVGFASDTEMLIAMAIFTMLLVAFSNAAAAGATWLIMRFSLAIGIEIRRELYASYLLRDFAQLSSANSADLTAKVTQGANRVVYNVIQPLLNLVSQAMVVLAVVIILVWYRPVAALAVSALVGVGYILLFRAVRSRLSRQGALAWASIQANQRHLAESFGGLKEIRLAGLTSEYQERFLTQVRRGAKAEALAVLLADTPRFVLETLTVWVLLGVAIGMLGQGVPSRDIVGVLSLFAMAGYRLLPAAQNVFKYAATIRASSESAFSILPDVLEGRRLLNDQRGDTRSEKSASAGLIEFKDVWFQYPGGKEPVLRGISVAIQPNTLTVIVGSSGSGKSTMADLLLGLLRPDMGDVTLAGASISTLGASWQRQLGYVAQSIYLKDDTIAANIAFGEVSPDSSRLRKAARLAGLEEVVDSLPLKFESMIGEGGSRLSGGQRQRIGIARALYRQVGVLVLDEATSALDGSTEHDVLESLLALTSTMTIVMVAHRVSTIRAADRIVLVSQGRVAEEGTFDDMMRKSEDFRKLVRLSERNSSQSGVDQISWKPDSP